MSEPIGPVWTSPETWVDPSCIECGGSGAPCCDPPDHPYPADPVTLVYVEAVAKMAGKVDALFDERDRLRAQRDRLLPVVEAALAYADGTGEPADTPEEDRLLDAVNAYRAALGVTDAE